MSPDKDTGAVHQLQVSDSSDSSVTLPPTQPAPPPPRRLPPPQPLICFLSFFFFFFFLGPHLQHMEVPRLGAKSELQLPAYTTTTATQDPSHIFDLHHSSRQRWIPNPLKEDRD